jgi:hypothetical protein
VGMSCAHNLLSTPRRCAMSEILADLDTTIRLARRRRVLRAGRWRTPPHRHVGSVA